jgi:methylenetetrahydrofolate reductase (NADPH)
MANLKPSCAHVTWGASGSTSDTSLEIAAMVQDQLAIPACLHLTCTNIQRTHLDQTLSVSLMPFKKKKKKLEIQKSQEK